MTATLLSSLLLATSGMIAVGSMTLVILLLMSEAGWRNGLGYVLGYVGGYTLMGVAAVWAGYQTVGAQDGGRSVAPALLTILLGVLLLVLALRNWRKPAGAAGTPRFFAIVDRITPLRALGLGALVTVINVKNLALFFTVLSVVIISPLSLVQKLVITLLDVLVFCSTVALPVIIYLFLPHRADRALGAIKGALERHSRAIGIYGPLFFGLLLIIKGVISLG